MSSNRSRIETILLTYLAAALASVFIPTVNGSSQPSNAVLFAGNSLKLTCGADLPLNYGSWLFISFNTTTPVTISDFSGGKCVQSPGYSQYNFNSTDPGQCDLIVDSVSVDEAGWYQCAIIPVSGEPFIRNAHITVLLASPSCSQNVTSHVAVHDVVSMKCQVSYSSGGVSVAMLWSGCQYGSESSNTMLNGNVMTSLTEINIVAQKYQYLETCSCNITTTNPTTPPPFTTGLPAISTARYEYVWTSERNILVQYCPDSVIMSEPTNSTLQLNATVTCRANGNPPPNMYSLTIRDSIRGQTVTYDSSVALSVQGQYEIYCSATNRITSGQQGNFLCSGTSPTYHYNVQTKGPTSPGAAPYLFSRRFCTSLAIITGYIVCNVGTFHSTRSPTYAH